MVDINEWDGLVRARVDTFNDLQAITPVGQAGGSWSGPVRVIASDQQDYFIKTVDTCPKDQEASLAIEFVVAEVGRLIGAPVCTTSLIRVPEELAGWEVRPGIGLTAGLAHASLALEHADEAGRPALASRGRDDNRRRHVGVYALFDWCCGTDAQWLYDIDNDRTLYSHDHGLYLPPIGTGRVERAALIAGADSPSELPDARDGLSSIAVAEAANALDGVDRASLVSILNRVPASWSISDEDLEALGWFLEHRAPAVSHRLRALA